jgi:cyclase
MKWIKFILTLAALHSPKPARASEDFSKETVKATQLTDSLYMLEGAGGNITASIGSDGVFLVDDDFAEMAPKLLGKLKELHGDSPKYIVNTHFHYDHTGGNEVFGSTATIIAATAVRDRLMAEQLLWKEKHPALPKHAWPVLTFERSLGLHFNGENIRIVHFPSGHTDGDTVVFFPTQKVVSMGDLYFSGMYPIFHLEHAGSLEGFVTDVERVWEQIPPDAKIVAGHGPLSTRAELRRYIDMIRASIAVVRKGMKSGLSLEAIQKAGLPAEWEPFSHGYLNTDRWIALVHKGLEH